jgi:DNA-binding Xre family transcriptional regulator
MLKLNIIELAQSRGIKNLTAHLMNFGFTYQPAFRLSSGKTKSLPVPNIEKLCLALNCTPSDLFTFTPSQSKPLPASHPLLTLVPKEKIVNLQNFTDEIPASKLADFSQKLEQLKSEFLKP